MRTTGAGAETERGESMAQRLRGNRPTTNLRCRKMRPVLLSCFWRRNRAGEKITLGDKRDVEIFRGFDLLRTLI